MKIKSLITFAFFSILTCTSVNAQIKIEENKSLAQIQGSGFSISSPNVEKVRAQVELNAKILATGIVCNFPVIQTESLHNFFLMQFNKYNFTKADALSIAEIHKNMVSQTILQKRSTLKTEDCERFKPEFTKIYEYAQESIK